jgi:N6-L-threonylcarbamoyladenine synthase
VRSNVIASQVDLHAPYGGVVPEVAARAHLELLQPTIDRALVEAGCRLKDIDAIAVTSGPGWPGRCSSASPAAKGLALARPAAARRQPPAGPRRGRPARVRRARTAGPRPGRVRRAHQPRRDGPAADGGFRQLGATIDDAAGEAFDKIARFLGLGYPGGPEIDRLARTGEPGRLRLPAGDGARRHLRLLAVGAQDRRDPRAAPARGRGEEPDLADVAASFQEAIVDVQVDKTLRGAAAEGIDTVVMAGGVAANSRLRGPDGRGLRGGRDAAAGPHIQLCTDNGAMVAASGANLLPSGLTLARTWLRPEDCRWRT